METNNFPSPYHKNLQLPAPPLRQLHRQRTGQVPNTNIIPTLGDVPPQNLQGADDPCPPHLPGQQAGEGVRAACAIGGGQGGGQQIPGVGEQLLQLLPSGFPGLQPGEEGGQLGDAACGQQLTEGFGAVVLAGGLLRRGQLPLHRSGADGGQQHGAVLPAEDKGRMGRPLLQHLQQHILGLGVQQGAVGEEVDLPSPLVGQDIGVGPHLAQDIHGDILVLRVLNGDDVGVDIPPDLLAGGAAAAGARRFPALHGGGEEAGGGGQIPVAAEDHRVGKGVPSGGLADALSQSGVAGERVDIRHIAASFCCPPGMNRRREIVNQNHFITAAGKKARQRTELMKRNQGTRKNEKIQPKYWGNTLAKWVKFLYNIRPVNR